MNLQIIILKALIKRMKINKKCHFKFITSKGYFLKSRSRKQINLNKKLEM
jgi:hypothetical protein